MDNLLTQRRSIRRYSRKKINQEKLRIIFDVVRYAPSAHNSQPWRYLIIDDPKKKKTLSEAMAKKWDKDLRSDTVTSNLRSKLKKDSIALFTKSPVLIIACISMENMVCYPDKKRQYIEYLLAVQSVAASIQTLLLAACHEGLGATWYCAPIFCQDIVRQIVGIPEHLDPQALITIGYPTEDPSPPPRLPLTEIVHYNKWGNVL